MNDVEQIWLWDIAAVLAVPVLLGALMGVISVGVAITERRNRKKASL
jgi:hypothetical protein